MSPELSAKPAGASPRRIAAGAALVLIPAGFLAAGYMVRDPGPPPVPEPSGLVVEGAAVHDFGERRQDEQLTDTFSLVNRSDTPVKVFELRASCHCLVAGPKEGLGATTVAPGGAFPLPVRFTTGASEGTTSGRVTVRFRPAAESAAPGPSGSVTVAVAAAVTPEYRIIPTELDFGVADGLTPQTVRHRVVVEPAAAVGATIRDIVPPAGRSTSEFSWPKGRTPPS